MACTKNLRTDLNPTADAGGVWTYVGYNSMSSTGPWNNTPANNMTGLAPNSPMVGDNPSIDPSLGSAGFYRFLYTVTNSFCTDVSNLTVEVKPVSCPGEDDSLSVCSNDAQFSLANAFVASSECDVLIGTLAGVSGSPVFGGAPNYNFNPSTNGAGVYVIRNSASVSPSPGFTIECDDCDAAADLTVTVNQFRSPGDERFVPYLSICIDPDCDTNLRDTLLNLPVGSEDGNWYLRSASPGYPSYASAQLTVTSTSLGTVTSAFSPDTLLSSGDVDCTVDFSDADPGYVYAFEYVIDAGGPCEVSQNVDIFVGPIPSAGTPPSPETICLTDLIDNGDGTMNLWDQLTGSPSTQGTWEVTHNGGMNVANALPVAFDDGNTSPLFIFSGQDDTFDFEHIRDFGGINAGPVSIGTTVTFNFNYTAQLPSQYVCANCEEQESTYSKTVIFNHRTGTTTYNSVPNAYQCVNGCTISLQTLVSGTIDPGAAWRMGSVGGVTDLIRIDPVGGPESPANFSFFSLVSFPVSNAQPGVELTLDFSLVPAGTYIFKLLGGTAPCAQETDVYITVTQPEPECTVSVTITAA